MGDGAAVDLSMAPTDLGVCLKHLCDAGRRTNHGHPSGVGQYRPGMHDADGYFGENAAATYDESMKDM
ncbi:hypothetical protein SAMN05428945_5213 [Streptomyces sp. 2224.1]|nr:hypothetical protein SAMN05428945_5213 [Streptomyces sp. 2224.1]